MSSIPAASLPTASVQPAVAQPAVAEPAAAEPAVVRPSAASVYDDFLKTNLTQVGAKSCDPFPMIEKAWDVFAGKGIRTVFLTVGSSKSPLADLEISESLGCPLHVVTLNNEENANWKEVASVLKSRSRDSSASAFTEMVDTKWILPKNVRLLETLPWWEKGTVDISGTQIPTEKVTSLISSLCDTMKLKDSAKRIDILKVDTTNVAPGLEIPIIGAIISAGFRPSVVLVKWSKMPDEDTQSMIAAGNLQCCGYSLLNTDANKFLYYFNDDNIYEICSWEQKADINPIAKEIINSVSKNTGRRL
jgi:hypothetical protein